MAVTQKDIAKRLNLSRSIVAHVLGDIPGRRVSAEVEARIRHTAAEMNYRPNRAAHMLSTGCSHIIGCWTYDPYTRYATRFLKGLEAHLRADGYDMIVSLPRSSDGDRGDLWPMDGLIVLDYYYFSTLKDTLSWQGPTVVMGLAQDAEGIDSVSVDVYSAARGALDHLISRDFRRIAFVTTPGGVGVAEPRFRAYSDALTEANLPIEYIVGEWEDRVRTHRAVLEHIQRHGSPQALFCCSDAQALPAYRAIYDLGLRIPQDVAVIGFDDIEDAAFWEPPLSSVRLPVEQMVATAWEYLKERIESPLLPIRHCVLPAEVQIRASTEYRCQSEPVYSTPSGGDNQ